MTPARKRALRLDPATLRWCVRRLREAARDERHNELRFPNGGNFYTTRAAAHDDVADQLLREIRSLKPRGEAVRR